MTSDEILALDRRHVWHPFTQAETALPPVVMTRGDGAKLYDGAGRAYLDLVSSWWVNLHGHGHPAIAEAVAKQAHGLEHVMFADYTHEPAARVAAGISAILPDPLNRVFFSDNGSTAVEVALKLALQYWHNLGQPNKTRFVGFENSYHGDTVGAMSTGATSGYFRAWQTMLFPVDFLPFPATWDGDDEIEAKETAALAAFDRLFEQHGQDIAGVIIEPLVQGASGMRMCRPSWLKAMTEKARAHGTLVIFDEVMTGFGRMGELFACLKAEVVPDMVCLSKGLTGGFLPMALTVCADAIYDAFLGKNLGRAFLHGHSFTANPLGCAAAIASLELLLDPACTARRQAIEAIHRDRLPRLARHPKALRPRITGTVAAVDIGEGGYGASIGPQLKKFFIERGLILRPLGNVLYLLPPYCISDDDLLHAYEVMGAALDNL